MDCHGGYKVVFQSAFNDGMRWVSVCLLTEAWASHLYLD